LRWKAVAVAYAGDDALAMALFEKGIVAGFAHNRADTFLERLIRDGNLLAVHLLMRDIEVPQELQRALLAAIEQGEPPDDMDALMSRNPRFDNATWHLLLRANDRAASYAGRVTTLVAQWDPIRADFRSSAAFRSIIERQGIPDYWREHGYPPQCRPVGDDYECGP
jgi:hypothetical protein